VEHVVIAALAAGMLVAAFGYAAVGHGGASASTEPFHDRTGRATAASASNRR